VGVRIVRDFCDVDGDDVDEEKEMQRKERRQWWR
jgi:hypothetical protein